MTTPSIVAFTKRRTAGGRKCKTAGCHESGAHDQFAKKRHMGTEGAYALTVQNTKHRPSARHGTDATEKDAKISWARPSTEAVITVPPILTTSSVRHFRMKDCRAECQTDHQ